MIHNINKRSHILSSLGWGEYQLFFYNLPVISKICVSENTYLWSEIMLLGIKAEWLQIFLRSVYVNGLCRSPGINISLNYLCKLIFLHLQLTLLSSKLVEDQQDQT